MPGQRRQKNRKKKTTLRDSCLLQLSSQKLRHFQMVSFVVFFIFIMHGPWVGDNVCWSCFCVFLCRGRRSSCICGAVMIVVYRWGSPEVPQSPNHRRVVSICDAELLKCFNVWGFCGCRRFSNDEGEVSLSLESRWHLCSWSTPWKMWKDLEIYELWCVIDFLCELWGVLFTADKSPDCYWT